VKIGLFCHNYPPHPGGLEVVAEAIAVAQACTHDVQVLTTAWADRRGESREHGLTVHRLPATHFAERLDVPYPVPLGPGLAGAQRAMLDRDVLHAHGALYATTLLACRVHRRTGAPLLLTEHVGFVDYGRAVVNAVQRLAWRTVGRHVLSHVGAVVVYNERVQAALHAAYPALRIEFIGNGVDLAEEPPDADERRRLRGRLGLPGDRPLALFVGRRSKKKNLDRVLAMERHGYRLAVVGGHPDLPPDVVDLGVVPHAALMDFYRAADLLVHAATGEGFPFAVQEAMASGLPVALLWDAGYAKVLDRGVVAAADDFSALARAVESLAADTELRAAIARAGHRWAQSQWSLAATAERYLALGRELAGR
jgi:glycosyltransferase involved in cell wall biosynthesis